MGYKRAGICSCTIVLILIVLPAVTIIGDVILRWLSGDDFPLIFRACFDSSVHICLGCLAWSVTLVQRTHAVHVRREILYAGIMSALIDVDHFIKARSLHLQDALHMESPPPMHDIVIPLVLFIISMILYCVNWYRNFRYRLLQFSVLHAVHLFRDAARRGLNGGFVPSVFPPHSPFGMFPFFIPLFPLLARYIVLLNEVPIEERERDPPTLVITHPSESDEEDEYERTLFY
ncbi:transmembrane protein 267-like [Paramacrobiotus metropolitanus]|uniref:transmembrane protein 267-like n=1 Tax=Paramacrobiotus metropolitanus TaxID=2943436 RepID=UPI002445A6CF|nr:transmembrane protein 267-like [Paramacrobiotus metropolitanus]XP_055337511.1 transmembrane protein 267-like [Paramacrobiotus metropolitanus]